MKEFNRILVPTDLSKHSLAAFEYAEYISRTYGASLYVLHVVDESSVAFAYPVESMLEAIQEESFTRAKEALNKFIGREVGSMPAMHKEVRQGDPSNEICRFADEHAITLIVIGTHGRTGLAHAVLGSTAERIVRHAHVPVMVVKPGHDAPRATMREAMEEVARS